MCISRIPCSCPFYLPNSPSFFPRPQNRPPSSLLLLLLLSSLHHQTPCAATYGPSHSSPSYSSCPLPLPPNRNPPSHQASLLLSRTTTKLPVGLLTPPLKKDTLSLVPAPLSPAFPQASDQTSSLTPAAASDLAWAIASLGYRPSTPWLDNFCLTTLQLGLEDFDAPGLSKMSWAMGKWRYIPPDVWLQVRGPGEGFYREAVRARFYGGPFPTEGLTDFFYDRNVRLDLQPIARYILPDVWLQGRGLGERVYHTRTSM